MIYGLTKLFKRGCVICLYTTYKCNLRCPYCINHLLVSDDIKGMLSCPEIGPWGWYDLISNFPVPVKEIFLSGGDPMLYPNISRLVDVLLQTGAHVVLFTNMMTRRKITARSRRFRIQATLHESAGKERFYDNVEYYRQQHHQVHVELFGTKAKKGQRTIKTKETDIDECRELKRFKFTPDGKLWISDSHLSDTYYRRPDENNGS